MTINTHTHKISELCGKGEFTSDDYLKMNKPTTIIITITIYFAVQYGYLRSLTSTVTHHVCLIRN